MKYFIILIALILPTLGNSQIFLETFNEGDGSTTGTDDIGGVTWTTTCPFSIAATDYFHIVNGVLEGRDTNGPAVFETDDIDITSCTNNIELSMDISNTGTLENSGGCNSVDIIKLEYSFDSGTSWSVIGNPVQGTTTIDTVVYSGPCGIGDIIGPFVALGDFTDFTNTNCIVVTSNVFRIRITVMEWADNEKHRIDNIQLVCSSCLTPLPIELINFDGFNNGDVNELYWSTASEINNDLFNIESSVNGFDWMLIGVVDGSGNSSQMLNYRFNHIPTSSITYYRLKQIDFDGKYEYSNIISISIDDDEVINIRYFDLLGKELNQEPVNKYFIKVIEYKYRTEHKKVFNFE